MTRFDAVFGAPSEKIFFPAVRGERDRELTRKKLTHSWASRDYKLYPSSIKSLTMCPVRYVQEDVHEPPGFDLAAFYKMEVGTALHLMYQNVALKVNNLCWEDPSFLHVVDPSNPTKCLEMLAKYKEGRPEVPVFDVDSGFSGRADIVMKVAGEPVVLDIKTTSCEDVQREMIKGPDGRKIWTGKWLENCWEAKKLKLPSEDHKIQVYIYCHLMNKFQYYSKPIKKAGLAYVNLLMKAGELPAEYETYLDFTPEIDAKIELLLKHLGLARTAYLEGKEIVCEYPSCRAHNL